MKPHTTIVTAALAASCGFGPPQAQGAADETTDAAEPFSAATGPRWDVLDGEPSPPPGHDTTGDAEPSTAGESDGSVAPSSSTDEGSTDTSSAASSSGDGSTNDPSPTSTSDGSTGKSSSSDAETTTGPDPCACCYTNGDPGCELPEIESCVCEWDDGVTDASYCCYFQGSWAVFCVDVAIAYCGLDCDAC